MFPLPRGYILRGVIRRGVAGHVLGADILPARLG